ncbi:hypothetical protein BVC93_11875 [Mycobacterium sp. MS1601]|uniref:flavin monoamine oxidase family protein n=1 Tax=Mycobacterium sp. MS1601 TaxID=1936029 RepID=UPI000979244A|nr:NAD(P)/FAD-dependent oxidoreductase [Mycobacterium sp. MS1601]AQA03016.1 hypothetical protein BVC93_11875 [Mycobacterium sp. MS1601]
MGNWDVIVVGAGFAGATAARECASRGLRVLVLEARDRIGGRSGSRPLSDGSPGDVGGTFVHWTQPHVWAEITRYGLEASLVRGREYEWMVTHAEGATHWAPAAEITALTRRAMNKALGGSVRVFPNPARPLQEREQVEQIDDLTIADALSAADIDDTERLILEMYLAEFAGRPIDQASWSAMLRWFALGSDNYDDFVDMEMSWRLECGTGGLLSRIIEDGGADVLLNSQVKSIVSNAGEVTVTLVDGRRYVGSSVIVAVPANVWSYLELSPALSPQQAEASRAGMTALSTGKAVAIIKGESRSMLFSGDAAAPIGFFTVSFREFDEQVIAIYPRDENFDITDTAVLRAAITRALPHVSVIDSVGDRYLTDDPLFRGGYGFLQPGQLTKLEPHVNFAHLDDRVIFASADIAEFFHGFIDGAIESGMHAARLIRTKLADDALARRT